MTALLALTQSEAENITLSRADGGQLATIPITLAPVAQLAQPLSFIVNPTAVAPLAPNVFNDWASMYAVASQVAGRVWVQFVGPVTIPAGTWAVDGWTFTSTDVLERNVTFAQGAVFTWHTIYLWNVRFVNASTNFVTTLSAVRGTTLWMFGSLLVSNAGAAAWLDVSGDTTVVTCIESVLGDGTHAAIQFDSGSLTVNLCNQSTSNANFLTGAGTIALRITSDSVVSAPTGGAATITFSSDAVRSNYIAAAVANWSAVNPTSVANALDRIAAKITPIP